MLNILIALGTIVPILLWICVEVIVYSRKTSRQPEKEDIPGTAVSDNFLDPLQSMNDKKQHKRETPLTLKSKMKGLRFGVKTSKDKEKLKMVKS